ncbi:gamma-glutamylcyclotransferase family protein [Natrialbaceae archaeon A-gly3]
MRVFVYGTLTDPGQVDAVLGGRADYEFVDRGTLEGLHRVEGRYPTLAPGGSVEGRVLEVDRAGLSALDEYEGFESGLYVRVGVPMADGERSAWVYVGDPTRLGVDDRVSWPGSGPFEERVEPYVRSGNVRLRTNE